MFYKHGAHANDNHYFRGFFRQLTYMLLPKYLAFERTFEASVYSSEYLGSSSTAWHRSGVLRRAFRRA